MCGYLEGQARSGAGVHSFVVELIGLTIQPFHLLSIPINPNVVLAWMDLDTSLAMCESASVPLFLVGIMPISGVEVLLRD